ATVILDGEAVGAASAAGWFFIGFDRDAAAAADLKIQTIDGVIAHHLDIAAGDFDVQRISGLPQNLVEPTDPALLERIKREVALKTAALDSRYASDAFKTGFVMPLDKWRLSARFGGQRILNGVPKTPHFGADLAAPQGSAILAPAEGLVTLAEPAMHFEGGLTMIDHGQGLTSYYLHQSRLDVSAGERVARGQRIGSVGMTGRATGPHLCWRLKWRGRNLDPMLLVGFTPPT
ncbi:MAG TPA: M23 family metallopeptidase, partial [Caulobacter sp.]|nr:M23 family metallopeptidase [Caulobacter sp.]